MMEIVFARAIIVKIIKEFLNECSGRERGGKIVVSHY